MALESSLKNAVIGDFFCPSETTLVYYNINDNDNSTTIYDLSGKGYHQTWSGTSNYSNDNTYGRVANFSTNNYTSCPDIINFGKCITFIALFKIDNQPSGVAAVASECQSSSTYATGIGRGLDYHYYVGFSGVGDMSNSNVLATTTFTSDWIMVAGTRDSSGNAKIFINGELNNSKTLTAGPTYSGTSFKLGQWGNNTNWLNGKFKMFIGENRTWDGNEIRNLAIRYGLLSN